MIYAVIGANYGDEGKGATTDWVVGSLCFGRCAVVRFNGGAQAGHTVVTRDGKRHVFSHFGSGTFRGADTYLGREFICNPIMFVKEQDALSKIKYAPRVIAHPTCRVTTYLDMMANQLIEKSRIGNKHGSCGLGIFETVRRHASGPAFSLSDPTPSHKTLVNYFIERMRCEAPDMIAVAEKRDYFSNRFYKRWVADLDTMRSSMEIRQIDHEQYDNIVFEGAQGLMLDKDNVEGMPHLTPSNTGLFGMLSEFSEMNTQDLRAYYVTRSYLTRHGAGSLEGELGSEIVDETNFTNEFQGKLRFAPLDTYKLRFRIDDDIDRFRDACPSTFLLQHLVVTHMNYFGRFRNHDDEWMMNIAIMGTRWFDGLVMSDGQTSDSFKKIKEGSIKKIRGKVSIR